MKPLSAIITATLASTALGKQQTRLFAITSSCCTNQPLPSTPFVIPRGGQGYNPDDNDDNYYRDDWKNNPQYNNRDDYYRDDQQDQRYYDRGDDYEPASRESSGGRSFVPEIIKTGNRKIGFPMLGIGAALTLAGITLFFNKTLMRLGNLFFVGGVPMTIGLGRTAGYFFQPKKARATACLAVGIFMVFIGWPVIGIILEGFGLLNLFGNMFPFALAILKTMPVIGPILKGEGRKPPRRARDDYYEDYDNRNDNYRDYRDDDDNQGYY